MNKSGILLCWCWLLATSYACRPASDPGGSESTEGQSAASAELPRYSGGVVGNAEYAHDGKLRWAVGVQSYQVIRSVPSNASLTDGYDAIWRHQQYIAYWGGYFWTMHDGGGTHIAWSPNGYDWSPARSAQGFRGDSGHHRMGFYAASNGRFLGSLRVGVRKGGPGNRLVQEIFGPGSFGDVYSIKVDAAGPFPDKTWPDYTTSTDPGFIAACDELRNNRLYVQQWQEEDNTDPNFYTIGDSSGTEWKAFNWYRRPDNRIVGTWKGVYHAVSNGSDWTRGNVSTPQLVTSFGYNRSSKSWGQRTEDGRYAMVGNTPGDRDETRRWPLAVTTSADGKNFNSPHLVVMGELPIQRYENAAGDDKNSGPQYVRGITPGNGDPPGTDMWLVYSMNKEDIWVSRVPTPIVGRVTSDIDEDFQAQAPGLYIRDWNTYSAQWAPASIVEEGANRLLRLEDRDPYDYATATRVFPESTVTRLSFQVRPQQANASTQLEIDVVGGNGDRAVALAFDPSSGQIRAYNGSNQRSVAAYSAGSWVTVDLDVFGDSRRYNLRINGNSVLSNAAFLESTPTVERLVFRTGAFRLRDMTRRPYQDGQWLTDRLPNADVPLTAAQYDLDNVSIRAGSGDRPPAGWVAVNGPATAGNDIGWHNSGPTIGGNFARSASPRYFVNTGWSRSLNRSDTFTFSGDVRLSNADFNGSFFIGYVDSNDLSPPVSLIGLSFDEPTSSASGAFRARATIRNGTGASNVASGIVQLNQNTTYRFTATWRGNADGSGTLSGNIGGTAFSISQGAAMESLSAFGVGVGLDGTSDPSKNTGPTYFGNLSFTTPGQVACGDGACSGGETCSSCAADCGACGPRCGDGACNGGESCSTCATDCAACAPAAPTGLNAVEASSAIRLTWNSVAGATGYTVKRSGSAGGPFASIGTTSGTSYDDGAVRFAATYFYVVAANNSGGESPDTSAVQAAPSVEFFNLDPALGGWGVENCTTCDGNSFGWNGSGRDLGGTFARSAVPRYYVNPNLGGSFRRSDTFSFSGDLRLSNRDANGSFFIGYVDRSDLSAPISVIGFSFDEPSGGAGNAFRARATVRNGGGGVSSSAVMNLNQNTTYTFTATWHGNSDGSGTLSGNIGGNSFSVSQGAFSESLNAFGVGVGLDSSSDANSNTGACVFDNLRYSFVSGGPR